MATPLSMHSRLSFSSRISPRLEYYCLAKTASYSSSPASPPSPQCVRVVAQCGPRSEIARIREALLSRERSAVDITAEYLRRLREREPLLRSFLHVSAEEDALREASLLDSKLSSSSSSSSSLEDLPPLAGVPVAVKDNLCTRGTPSSAGSRILEGYCPPFDATTVKKMKEAGAILVGKTNMDEFGMGSTTEASAYQVTCNPWDLTRVPGGSSGGSAAAVAGRQCVCSLGSDTGGSIRQPASFCGVVGLKPSYGRVSRFGLMAFASSLDVVGCIGTSVLDTAIVLGVIAGQDKFDATSSLMKVPRYSERILHSNISGGKPMHGLRVGIIKEIDGGVEESVSSAVMSSVQHLETLGASIVEVSLPSFSLGLPAYYTIASSEASSNLARYDGVRYGSRISADELMHMYENTRATGFGVEVKRRILTGTYALSAGFYDAYYKKAQQVRTLIQSDFKQAFEHADVLVSPAAPTPAYRIGEKINDPLSMYAGDLMTVNVNLAGLPALVVPCGFTKDDQRLPIGLQFIGNMFDEERLLEVGHIFEQTTQAFTFMDPLELTTSIV